jgi:protocatechuate 4,5-dioxygenase beta chain/2'-aminobiphenyl-2,3-diol 1,2-dioxygenase large subunit
VVVVTGDHLQNFRLDRQIPFAVGLSDRFTPLGDMDIPQEPFPGHREFASGLIGFAAEQDFDLVGAEHLRPDHGLALPNAVINVEGHLPVVPLYLNSVMTPPPSCRRSLRLGRVLRDYVERCRPAAERVAIVGAGGLSHWLCMPGEGRVNAEWDRSVIDAIVTGQAERLARLTAAEIVESGGNGGLEIVAWLCMAGAVPGASGDLIYYEPMPEWWTGMGGIAMTVQ